MTSRSLADTWRPASHAAGSNLRLVWDASAPATATEEPFVSAEQFFAELDGRRITVGDQRRRLRLYSVRDEDGSRWIQLSAGRRKTDRLITLRLAPGKSTQHALMALSSWLARPDREIAAILNVA